MEKHKIAPDLIPLAQPIDTLKLLPGNPRKGDIDAVAKSYNTFGQRKPIVATTDGTVIAGNHQLQAAQKLGWTHIAVVYVQDDETTAKAYALADNRTSDLGTYDDYALMELIEQIAEQNAELLSNTGYNTEDIEMIMAGNPEPLDSWLDAFEHVPDGDKPEYVQMSFTLHEQQADALKTALEEVKPRADYTLNPNKNGAALATIIMEWLKK